MRRTANATPYSVYILIALRAVLGKIDAGTEHSTNIRMSFIKSFLDDRIDKRTAME